MRLGGDESRPWEQQEGESAVAYEAFLAFRDAGLKRTVKGTAAALGKSRSLISAWASSHSWRERVRAWDREQQRREEATIRQERESALRRMFRHLDQLGQLALARLLRLAGRDPITGEIAFDPAFSPQVAAGLLKFVLPALERREGQPTEDEEGPKDRLRQLPSSALERLVNYVTSAAQEDEDEQTQASPTQ